MFYKYYLNYFPQIVVFNLCTEQANTSVFRDHNWDQGCDTNYCHWHLWKYNLCRTLIKNILALDYLLHVESMLVILYLGSLSNCKYRSTGCFVFTRSYTNYFFFALIIIGPTRRCWTSWQWRVCWIDGKNPRHCIEVFLNDHALASNQ